MTNFDGEFDGEEVYRAWLKNTGMDKVRRYVEAGRRFSKLNDTNLVSQWITSFRAFCGDSQNAAVRAISDDLGYEMELRGIELPYEEVEEDFKKLQQEITEYYERLKGKPQEYKFINDSLRDDVVKFLLETEEGSSRAN